MLLHAPLGVLDDLARHRNAFLPHRIHGPTLGLVFFARCLQRELEMAEVDVSAFMEIEEKSWTIDNLRANNTFPFGIVDRKRQGVRRSL